MALSADQVQVRDLVMGPGTDYQILVGFNPFNRSVRADQSGKRAWNHGSWSGVEWADEAVVPLRILIDTDDENTWLVAHQKLMAAFRPVGEITRNTELRFHLGGREFVMFGRPRMVEPELDLIGLGKAFTSAAFVALDPLIYAGAETVVPGIGLPTFTGGLTIPGSPNLITNFGFEANTSGWSAIRGTITRDTTQAHNGTASARYDSDTAVTGQRYVESEKVAVAAGKPYRASAFVLQGATFATAQVNVNWFDASGVYLSTSSGGTATLSASWQRIDGGDFTPPANATQATVVVEFTPDSGATAAHAYADSVQLRDVGGGLTVPFTVDATLSDSRVELANPGTADTGMLIRLDGPAPQPRVVLQRADGTNQQLRFDFMVPAGQFVEVDTSARTVMLNGTTNRRGQTIGDFPILPPGTHTLRWFADDYDAAAQMTVRFRGAWW
jgi:hypothetical protein